MLLCKRSLVLFYSAKLKLYPHNFLFSPPYSLGTNILLFVSKSLESLTFKTVNNLKAIYLFQTSHFQLSKLRCGIFKILVKQWPLRNGVRTWNSATKTQPCLQCSIIVITQLWFLLSPITQINVNYHTKKATLQSLIYKYQITIPKIFCKLDKTIKENLCPSHNPPPNILLRLEGNV